MTGRHARRTRIERAQHSRGWRVKVAAYDRPASAWNVYRSWPLALDAAQRERERGIRQFLPIGWERVRIDRKYQTPIYVWRFAWRCNGCGIPIHKPAAHECTRWVRDRPSFDDIIGTAPDGYRPRWLPLPPMSWPMA